MNVEVGEKIILFVSTFQDSGSAHAELNGAPQMNPKIDFLLPLDSGGHTNHLHLTLEGDYKATI